ncbi:hypothetical protein N7539_001432 [Penicillium diatomitis]|uniref:Uncharacterized protein n=1 Tax=Penicillium diatomitis TaxID=2819901 RepID=A0A9X0BZW2_9EURO|nr:uncharacterized protein N7539_001432 [Penicillium diatomitis]KAJ5492686.1 hypothetical protein N7539_001432 [Penicillium diatomitis]
MAGRAETRTPEPPDRDEHEASPPRLTRPRRTTRPPNNYTQEQEIGTEQRLTRAQSKKKCQGKAVLQHDAVSSDDASTESEDLSATNLLKELVKLRKEIRRRDDVHKNLQTLADRSPTPQALSEPCSQNGHDEILREIHSLRIAINPSDPASGSLSYADIARTPLTSYPSNLVKEVSEAKVGAGARVLRDELHPIKVDSVNKAAVLDEKA